MFGAFKLLVSEIVAFIYLLISLLNISTQGLKKLQYILFKTTAYNFKTVSPVSIVYSVNNPISKFIYHFIAPLNIVSPVSTVYSVNSPLLKFIYQFLAPLNLVSLFPLFSVLTVHSPNSSTSFWLLEHCFPCFHCLQSNLQIHIPTHSPFKSWLHCFLCFVIY